MRWISIILLLFLATSVGPVHADICRSENGNVSINGTPRPDLVDCPRSVSVETSGSDGKTIKVNLNDLDSAKIRNNDENSIEVRADNLEGFKLQSGDDTSAITTIPNPRYSPTPTLDQKTSPTITPTPTLDPITPLSPANAATPPDGKLHAEAVSKPSLFQGIFNFIINIFNMFRQTI